MKMRINKLLDRAPIPDNGGELLFYQRSDDYTIEVAGMPGELMTTAHHGSEDALAELALRKVKNAAEASVVIGGLGMGFTLAAVLKLVGEKGKVVVAELVPQVLEMLAAQVEARMYDDAIEKIMQANVNARNSAKH